MNVWQDTTTGNGDRAQELGKLLVVSDGELNVSWNDSALLVVSGGVSGQLENLGGEVLKDGGEVHWGTSANTGSVAAGAEVAVDTAHRELETGLCRAGGRLS